MDRLTQARRVACLVMVVSVLLVGHTGLSADQGPTQAELNTAQANTSDWLLTNHDYGGQRYVDLQLINRENAARLRPVCRYHAGGYAPFQTNPIVYRGVMYMTTTQATVALDATTCEVRWRHDWQPKAKQNWPQQRGVALKEGRVVRGTNDGYLLALDAATGELLWAKPVADANKGESLTMPPVIYEDLVIIGPAGSENAIKGWIGAFRLADGTPVWRFNTVPGAGEPGADTWSEAPGQVVGGGAIWTPLSLDPATGLVYVPVTNPAPDFYGEARRGDNLYTNSMVVLHARSGALQWYYQFVPHDTHDWDLTQVSPLFTTTVHGTPRKLVAAVGKSGLLHVLDRETRALLYQVPVTSRRNVDVALTVEGVHACPGVLGGVQWNGPAYNPKLNTLYVPSVDWCGTYKLAEELRFVQGKLYMGGQYRGDSVLEAHGWLTAIDAANGTIRWRYRSPRPMLAAVTTTSAELIFTGELTEDFIVLDARDGTVLYRFNTDGPLNGGVITYAIEGRQYVAAMSGNATPFWAAPPGSATVVIFALP